jgi:cytoskeletal protein CcmA (bactofilin family)
MSIRKSVLGFGVAVLLFLSISVGVVSAQEFRSGSSITTPQNEVIDSTLYASGQTIHINSEVFGDVFCIGQTINISGDIHGDIICAGQTINISGNVDGDIRLAAQTITISSQVDGNASVVTQTLTTQSDGEITGDLTIGAELVTLGGSVGRDVAATASNIVIANNIGRNLIANVETLELLSSAAVEGNIEYTSSNTINQSPNASVGGEINRTEPKDSGSKGAALFGVAIAWFIYMFLAMLFTSMALALIFPSVLQSTTDRIITSPWKALLVGLASSIAIPVFLIILGVTIIGVPLMILLGLMWLVIIMLSGPFTAYYIGRLLFSSARSVLLTMFVGSIVLLVLYFIPVLGVFVLLGVYWLGTGMILLELMRRTPKPVYVSVNSSQAEIESKTSVKPKPKKTTKTSSSKKK